MELTSRWHHTYKPNRQIMVLL